LVTLLPICWAITMLLKPSSASNAIRERSINRADAERLFTIFSSLRRSGTLNAIASAIRTLRFYTH